MDEIGYFSIRSNCALCESRKIENVLSFKPTPIANTFHTLETYSDSLKGNKIPLSLLKCEDCGHVQIRELIREDFLFNSYPYKSSTSRSMRQRLEQLALNYCARYPEASSVVEIGSNDNYLLKCFSSKGLKCLGVDPAFDPEMDFSSEDVMQIKDFFNDTIVDEILEKIGYPDLIIANNVLAHNSDLNRIFKGISLLTSKKSRVFMEVSYLGSVIEKSLIDTIYHEHFSYHSIRSLDRFVRKFDLEIFEIKEFDAHGGSVRLGMRRKTSEEDISDLEKYRTLEESLDTWENWSKLQLFVDKLGEKITHSVVKEMDDVPLFGYGISAKFSTLYHGVGLEGIPFSGFLDDNPLKIMKLAPGTNRLIEDSAILKGLQIFDLFMFSWNYASEILKRFEKSAPRRTWIPLPELMHIRGTML